MTATTVLDQPGKQAKAVRSALKIPSAALALAPAVGWAHVGSGNAYGFAPGFSHPFTGIDHILAMIAVGWFAARLGGRALWLVPLTFVSVMALAGVAGTAGLRLPFVETGIGLSVVVLGLAIAVRLNVSMLVATPAIGLFAIFHGYAHGAETPESAAGLLYGAGFVLAAMLLHAFGVGLGIAIGKTAPLLRSGIAQASGTAIALAGMAILAVP